MLVEEIDRLNNVLREKSKAATDESNRNRQLIDDLRHKDERLHESSMKV